jgi:hypothetical protein
MNAAEYQQRHISDRDIDLGKSPKRTSKSKEFDESHATPLTSVEATPPRRVTPNPAAISPARDFEYRHKPTVTNSGLNYVSPLKPKEPNMKYTLGNGFLEKNTSARLEKENFDQGKMPSSKTPGVRFPPHASSRKSSSNVIGNSKNKLLSSSRRKQDPNSYKIFLLLLQPKLKTFELIQLIYSPNDTTIGDIIAMIPENATEPALGSQTYTGLCRPKTEEEIVDHELLASEPPRANTGVDSAKITLGEILVAIPVGYNGADVAVLAKQILSNPKIVKLLKRSNPLAPKKSRRSSRRGLGKGVRRSRSKEHVEVMEKFDEEDEIKQEQEKKDQEERMRDAMEHAAQEAAASNALIPGRTIPDLPKTMDRNVSRSASLVSLEESLGEEKSMESSLQESIDESFSSWSKSFDASFATSVCSGVSKRSVRRRDRQSRRMKIIQRSVVAGFVIMLAMYFMDPHGYRRTDEEKQVSQAATTENPMGLTGIFQCLFLLLSLYQLELFARTTARPSDRDGNGEGQSSFLEFIQSTKAMKKLKSRFYKKLKKPSTRTHRGAVGAYDYDENNLTQKLRSFQLKGRNSLRSSSLDECDTGSL